MYGFVRSAGTGGALAVLFAGGEMAVSGAAEVETATLEPDRRWTLSSEGLDLVFEALGPPAELGEDEPAARAGGMAGRETLCRVTGTVAHDGRTLALSGAGQREQLWGEPDWSRIEVARTLSAWLEDGTGLAYTSVRPAGARGHEAEARWAALLAPAGGLCVDDPRLSTTYDGDGFQRRAGLELWIGEDDSYPRRASGEVVCGGALDLGAQRLDCAFLHWRMDGRSGIGRYDVLRRA
jgi:hypothetical protein